MKFISMRLWILALVMLHLGCGSRGRLAIDAKESNSVELAGAGATPFEPPVSDPDLQSGDPETTSGESLPNTTTPQQPTTPGGQPAPGAPPTSGNEPAPTIPSPPLPLPVPVPPASPPPSSRSFRTFHDRIDRYLDFISRSVFAEIPHSDARVSQWRFWLLSQLSPDLPSFLRAVVISTLFEKMFPSHGGCLPKSQPIQDIVDKFTKNPRAFIKDVYTASACTRFHGSGWTEHVYQTLAGHSAPAGEAKYWKSTQMEHVLASRAFLLHMAPRILGELPAIDPVLLYGHVVSFLTSRPILEEFELERYYDPFLYVSITPSIRKGTKVKVCDTMTPKTSKLGEPYLEIYCSWVFRWHFYYTLTPVYDPLRSDEPHWMMQILKVDRNGHSLAGILKTYSLSFHLVESPPLLLGFESGVVPGFTLRDPVSLQPLMGATN